MSARFRSYPTPFRCGGTAAWWGVTTGRRRWLVVAAVAVAPVGFTFSRDGLLSLGLLAAGFAVGALRPGVRRGPSAIAAVLLCVGFAVPAAVWSSGWLFRANQTTSATTAANELSIGFYSDSGFDDTLTAGAGYTSRTNVSPTGDIELFVEDTIVSQGATAAASVSTGSATIWEMATVVFKS